MSPRHTLISLAALTAALAQAAFAGNNDVNVSPYDSKPLFKDAGSFSELLFGDDFFFDNFYDSVQEWKKEVGLPISIGAHHWWHVDRDERIYGNGYGVPGERGTYYYWLNIDPKITYDEANFLQELGFHGQARFRDDPAGTPLRGFYDSNTWSYEAYGYGKTDWGTFKLGQIVEKFAIAWDNTWWEGVTYFDEYRFNPSWGAAWDNTWKGANENFHVDTSLQYFITGDHVSGALVNASAQTTAGMEEEHSFIIRAVPTWKLNENTTLAVGLGGLTRGIDAGVVPGMDDRQWAYDVDATLSWKNWSVWAQYIDSHGVITPARYVSGGPSDRQNSLSTGINYKLGPLTSIHLNYSKGWDHNPDGEQFIWQPGITFQLTKNMTLYTEYVKWDVTNSAGITAPYDDGFEFALVWTF